MKIQNALRNVLDREVDRIKNFEISSKELDDGMHLAIVGAVAGAAIAAEVIYAGGVMGVPAYATAQAMFLKDGLMQYISENERACIAVGSTIAGAGAMVFLKGLYEESVEIGKRWDHAFDDVGHGKDLISAINSAADTILTTQSRVNSAIDYEKSWIEKALPEKDVKHFPDLRALGYDLSKYDCISELKSAYAFGVKQAFVSAIDHNQDLVGTLKMPTKFAEQAIIKGMTDYFTASRSPEPGLVDKLKFSFFGKDDTLKSREEPSEIARAGYRAIKQIRSKDSSYGNEAGPSMG